MVRRRWPVIASLAILAMASPERTSSTTLSSTERPRRPAHRSGHDCARRLREHNRGLDVRWNTAPGTSHAVAAIAVSERALGGAHPADAPADGPAGGRPPHLAGRPGPLHEDRKHGPRRGLHCERRHSLLSRPGCRELPLRRFTRRRTSGGGPQRGCAERSRRCRNQATRKARRIAQHRREVRLTIGADDHLARSAAGS